MMCVRGWRIPKPRNRAFSGGILPLWTKRNMKGNLNATSLKNDYQKSSISTYKSPRHIMF
jgi:RAB protein geranylgeranyltransferase component A